MAGGDALVRSAVSSDAGSVIFGFEPHGYHLSGY